MATLLYIAMRRLWNDEKRKIKYPDYGYEDDPEDDMNGSFSDQLFFDDEEHGEEHGQELEAEHQDEHQDELEDDPEDYPDEEHEEKEQSPDSDTNQDRKKMSENSTQTDEDDLEITISIRFRNMELTIPAERARTVVSLTDENTQTSAHSATVSGNDVVCTETTVKDTETLGE